MECGHCFKNDEKKQQEFQINLTENLSKFTILGYKLEIGLDLSVAQNLWRNQNIREIFEFLLSIKKHNKQIK